MHRVCASLREKGLKNPPEAFLKYPRNTKKTSIAGLKVIQYYSVFCFYRSNIWFYRLLRQPVFWLFPGAFLCPAGNVCLFWCHSYMQVLYPVLRPDRVSMFANLLGSDGKRQYHTLGFAGIYYGTRYCPSSFKKSQRQKRKWWRLGESHRDLW